MKKWDPRKVRRWAEFASSLPTDLIEDRDGIIQNGGKSVAAAIGEILRGLGCDVERRPMPGITAGISQGRSKARTSGAR